MRRGLRVSSAARSTCIVDEVDEEGALGRSMWDAPEIDGSVFLNGDTDVKPGDILKARVAHADEYDLWAERK